MEPVVTAALIGAGANLLSGMMGKDAQEDANAQAKEAAQMGIRWRVADAKAAGLHPLFALGGGAATYSPAPVTAMADAIGRMGQDLSRAAGAQTTPSEKEARDLQLQLVRSQIAESDARTALANSQAMRNLLGDSPAVPLMPPAHRPGTVFTQGGTMPGGFIGLEPFTEGSYRERYASRGGRSGQGSNVPMIAGRPSTGVVEGKAGEQYSASFGNRGIGAEQNPSLSVFHTPSGLPMLLPSKPGAEAMEPLEPFSALYVVRENLATFGPEWAAEFIYGKEGLRGLKYFFGAKKGESFYEDLKWMARKFINRRVPPHPSLD